MIIKLLIEESMLSRHTKFESLTLETSLSLTLKAFGSSGKNKTVDKSRYD